MPTPSRKGVFIVLLALVLAVGVAIVPDIISEEMRAWCLNAFGEGYQKYLLGFFVLGSVVLLFLTTDLAQHLRPGAANTPPDRSPGTPDPELVAKVRKYLTERYDHRLSQKMAGRQPVNLRILPSVTGTTKEGAENYITLQEEEVRAAIGDIFTRANGRLLLVGLPGAGKTTLVLQLALHLLERPGNEMPVVLNLATWRAEFKTFEEWLKKILSTELGATPALAEQIRNNTPLILLLDGLDEVPEADRDSLLAGIGEYGADAARQFLISSRIAEYAATKDAPVNAQVEVAPLTVEQVEMGLAATAGLQPESRRLLNALKSDPRLRSAVENPFYLNTAQLLFSTGKKWSELGFVAQDVAGRQRELVERFISGILGRSVQHEYPADKAEHWLSFLASRMTERNMVVFELRDLQYDWWHGWSKHNLVEARLVETFVAGITAGIFLVPISGLIFGALCELFIWENLYDPIGLLTNLGKTQEYRFISGLLYGLTYSFILMLITFPLFGVLLGLLVKEPPKIETKSIPRLSLWHLVRIVKTHLRIIVYLGIFLGLLFGLILWLIELLVRWPSNAQEVIVFIETTTKRLYYSVGFGILISVVLALTISSYDIIVSSNISRLVQISKPYERFYISGKIFHFTILQHILLHFQLYKKSLLPPNLVQYLNELSLRHILEFDGDPHTGKGGGTWRFRHRILQNYFTAKYFADNASNGSLEELVEKHLHDDTWEEIFMLVARMLPNADELLWLMLKKNRELLHEPILNRLIGLSERALKPSNNKYSTEARKSAIIFIALDSVRHRDQDLARDYFTRSRGPGLPRGHDIEIVHTLTFARNSARDLALALDPRLLLAFNLDGIHPAVDDHEIADAIERARLNASARDRYLARDLFIDPDFHFDFDRGTLGDNAFSLIVENISRFLKANILIAQCLSSATYLSKSTREHVLRMRLAPREEEE